MGYKCYHCGKSLSSKVKICPRCGKDLVWDKDSEINAKKINKRIEDDVFVEETPVEENNVKPTMDGNEVKENMNNVPIQYVQQEKERTKLGMIVGWGGMILTFVLLLIAMLTPTIRVLGEDLEISLSLFDYLGGNNSFSIEKGQAALIATSGQIFYAYAILIIFAVGTIFLAINKKILHYISLAIGVVSIGTAIVFLQDVQNVVYIFRNEETTIYFIGMIIFLFAGIVLSLSAFASMIIDQKNK